jgi:hypothetical protein
MGIAIIAELTAELVAELTAELIAELVAEQILQWLLIPQRVTLAEILAEIILQTVAETILQKLETKDEPDHRQRGNQKLWRGIMAIRITVTAVGAVGGEVWRRSRWDLWDLGGLVKVCRISAKRR